MSGNAAELNVGANGKIWVAPLSTTVPTTPIATPAGGWVDLGYVDEKGVTATDTKTLQAIPVWQLFYPARRIVTARDFDMKFNLRQWNSHTVPLAFGGGTIAETSTGSGFWKYEPPSPEVIDERMLMVDWVDGIKHYRWVLFAGLVSDNVATNIVRTATADLPITFSIIGVDGQVPYRLITDDVAFSDA